MAEPTLSTDIFGVKLASIVAGFAGGVVSLSFVRQLNPFQSVLAVVTGALSAGYITPAVAMYIGSAIPESSAAFVVGLTAMNIVPGILKLSEMFKRNPAQFIGRKDSEK